MAHPATDQFEQALHKIFLAIEVGNFDYGIPVECVREIVYQVKLNPLPQTPDFVRGVAVIRDDAIPVLDLNILLGGKQPTRIHEESCYIIIQLADCNQALTQVCLLADQIFQTYKINIDDIDAPPAITEDKLINYVLGVSRIHDHVLILFEPADLISPFLNSVTPYVTYTDASTASDDDEAKARKAKNRYLSIYANEEEFAFPLPAISQVINTSSINHHIDEDIPEFVSQAGIYNDQLIVTVSLAEVTATTNNQQSPVSHSSRDVVVLVELRNGLMGIVVSHIGESYESEVEPQKNSICSDLQRSRINSLGFIKKGDESIEIINPFGFFSNQELVTLDAWMQNINRIMTTSNSGQEDETADGDEVGPYAQYAGSYLVTQVGEYFIGLDNRYVDEVLSYKEILPMKNGPHWFPGVIDLRDKTYPVIDLHKKFDLGPVEKHPHHRNVLVMIRNNDHKVGLMVDKVMHSVAITDKQLSGNDNSNLYIIPEALNATADTSEGIVHIIDLVSVIELPEVSGSSRMQVIKQDPKAT